MKDIVIPIGIAIVLVIVVLLVYFFFIAPISGYIDSVR